MCMCVRVCVCVFAYVYMYVYECLLARLLIFMRQTAEISSWLTAVSRVRSKDQNGVVASYHTFSDSHPRACLATLSLCMRKGRDVFRRRIGTRSRGVSRPNNDERMRLQTKTSKKEEFDSRQNIVFYPTFSYVCIFARASYP